MSAVELDARGDLTSESARQGQQISRGLQAVVTCGARIVEVVHQTVGSGGRAAIARTMQNAVVAERGHGNRRTTRGHAQSVVSGQSLPDG